MTISDIKQALIDPYVESLKKICNIELKKELRYSIEVEEPIDYTNSFSTILFNKTSTNLLKRHLLKFFNSDLGSYESSITPAHISITYYITNNADPQDTEYKIFLSNQEYLTLKLESLNSDVILEFYPIMKYNSNWHSCNSFLLKTKSVRKFTDLLHNEIISSSTPDQSKAFQALVEKLDSQQLVLSDHFKLLLKESDIICEEKFSEDIGTTGLAVTFFLTDPNYTITRDPYTFGWALKFTIVTKADRVDKKDLRFELSKLSKEFAVSCTRGLSALFNTDSIDINLDPIIYLQQQDNRQYESYIRIADDYEVKSILNKKILELLNVKTSLHVNRIKELKIYLSANNTIDQDDVKLLFSFLEGLGFEYLIYPTKRSNKDNGKINTLEVSIYFQPILNYRDTWYHDEYSFIYNKKTKHLTFNPTLSHKVTTLDKSAVKLPNEMSYYPKLYQFISSMLESDFTELTSYNIISNEKERKLLVYTAFILTHPDLIYTFRDLSTGWMMDINIENYDDNY